jgi:hypothetical protein
VDAVKASGLGVDTEHAITARYVLLTLATNMTGYTIKAMQRKIERGEWSKGKCGCEHRTAGFSCRLQALRGGRKVAKSEAGQP